MSSQRKKSGLALLLANTANWSRRFAADTRGVIAIKFALAVPAIGMISLGAIDLYAVQSDRDRMQAIADSAALAGGRELGIAVDDEGPRARALAHIQGQLVDWVHAPSLTPTVEVITLESGERAVRAHLAGHRPSFFGNMLPPGGWNMNVDAVATSLAVVPLCVLAHGASGDKVLNVRDQASLRAPACLVHSNRDIVVENVGRITAAAVHAVTAARGNITPSASTGAVAIADPFSEINLGDSDDLRDTMACTPSGLPNKLESGRHVLPAGVHCDDISVERTAELVLAPGDHWFLGAHLTVKDDARLSGSDVVLLFDKGSKFQFQDHALVALGGRRSGLFAGMVMLGTRDNTQTFVISSDNVETLLGVIYIPAAKLRVEGSGDVARESAWTVIVAQEVELKGGPSLFINANYSASDVPVPSGVGPTQGGSRLVQ